MALVTLAEVKTHLGVKSSTHDAQLASFITSAEANIYNWVRRTSFESATYTEYPQGLNSKWLRLREMPVTSITSVAIDSERTFASSATLATTEYSLINGGLYRVTGTWPGVVQRRSGLLGASVQPSNGIIKVVYVAGYATVPEDIKYCVKQAVARTIAVKGGGALKSESLDGYTYTLDSEAGRGDALGEEVRKILNKYKRVTV